MPIYTRDGDKGYTTNLVGEEISKSSIYIELQGCIDEINAHIGYLRSILNDIEKPIIDERLKRIQHKIFLIGAEISADFSQTYVKAEESKWLEKEIDSMTNEMSELEKFIYQSGVEASAYSHVVRCIIRRTERIFVKFLEGRQYPDCYQYINRLSDYFFTLSRYINKINKVEDEILNI